MLREIEVVLVYRRAASADTSIKAPKVRPPAVSGTTMADSIPSLRRTS